MNAPAITTIPSWLETPPPSPVRPPVQTRLQDLPFNDLAWEDFERLCLRLARLEAEVEHCQLYGERGQEQQGIDIYARLKLVTPYRVYQCKRVKSFTASKIKSAVKKFLDNDWATRSDMFILCTTDSLIGKDRAGEVEAQHDVLRHRGITFVVWDSHQLSLKLKDLPRLVDDFFGRAWVAAFCGQDIADHLGKRLDATDVATFRRNMAAFYQRVFLQHDSGLPGRAASAIQPLPLAERYVIPDITDSRPITISQSTYVPEEPVLEKSAYTMSLREYTRVEHPASSRSSRTITIHQPRHPVETWLVRHERNIILGGPGTGKSSLLRFITLDLLLESPHLNALAGKWGGFLPVWLPFALWTKMISNSNGAECSLKDVLYSWFKRWDEERLWPLVEQTLDDERLLLLVDGLDEWTEASAGQIAVQRLNVFVGQRSIPAIATTRPHGFDRLSMPTSDWQVGELSDFSPAQQMQLVQIWFTHWFSHFPSPTSTEAPDIDRQVSTATQAFLNDLRKSADLRDLAKVPLLLCLLIYLRLQNASLPQNRFKAYDLVIDHLISTHPQKRIAAASITANQSELSDEDTKKVLAYLAYEMHIHHSEGIIDERAARSVVVQHLMDIEHGFGFEGPPARQIAHNLIEIGQERFGLLVRAAPSEIKFFHRSSQEYLAAYYLALAPFQEQLSFVDTYCVNPQWHEVILGLFGNTKRAEDLQQFVRRMKERTASKTERMAIELLLCELAFGDFNCSVSLVRELAAEAFAQIERESWMPQRERLLRIALDGLRSAKARELVKAQITRWFPQRIRWRDSLYAAMTRWSLQSDVIDCLWLGLYAEEASHQRAAAKALAKLAAGNPAIGDQVADLSYSALDPKVRAAAIRCLLDGWKEYQEVNAILDSAATSMSPETQLAAIAGLVEQGRQTDEHRQALLRLASQEADLDYHWRDDLVPLLTRGWPQNPDTKERCLQAVNQPKHRAHEAQDIVTELAESILLEGYPNDEEVAQYCVRQVAQERHPFLMSRQRAWYMLYQNFRDHPAIVAAIDAWLPQQSLLFEMELVFAAMVGCTPVSKMLLLEWLGPEERRHPAGMQWPAWALLEHWGMQDVEVAAVLNKIAYGPAEYAAWIAHLLPDIIGDEVACRTRLFQLLRDPTCTWYTFILSTIQKLNKDAPDLEVPDVLLSLSLDRHNHAHQDVIAELIADHSYDDRARQLALRELNEPDGNYTAVAAGFGHDPSIRATIIEMANPLPAYLRSIIAEHFGEASVEEGFTLDLLAQYDRDADVEVKSQASISYHQRLRAAGRDTSSAVATLTQNIVATGFDLEERRQAAFSGLITLDRLDVIQRIQEDNEPLHRLLPGIMRLRSNTPLIRQILHDWQHIEATLGSDFIWEALHFGDTLPDAALDMVSAFADEYTTPREIILRALESGGRIKLEANTLRFLSRVRPRSPLLLEHCLQAVQSDLYPQWSDRAIVAAEILGTQYSDDPTVMTRLLHDSAGDYIYEAQVIALCEGWVNTHEFEQVFERVHNRRPMSYALYGHLLGRRGSSEKLFGFLNDLFEMPRSLLTRTARYLIRPIVRRLGEDDELFELISDRLKHEPTPSEKASFTRLLVAARGLSPELARWCERELSAQCAGNRPSEVGIELSTGEIHPVVHILLEALSRSELSAVPMRLAG